MTTPPPLTCVYFYLTEGCNLACRHCWLNPPFDPKGTRHPVLPVATIRQVIAEAKPLGLKSVKLTGGEALLHPQLLDILALTKAEQLGLIIETNGTLVTDPVLAALRDYGDVFVSVSLDSHRAEVHDAFRGVKGSFALTVDGIRRLAAAGLRPQVIGSLIPENRHEMEPLVRLAQQLGAGSFKMNVVQPTTRGGLMHQRGQSVSLPEILEVSRDLVERLAPATGMRIHPDVPFAFRALSAMHRDGGGRCTVKHIVGVLANGRYALCGIGTSMAEMVFGRAGIDDLATIWASHPMLQSIRRDLPDKLTGICGRCLMKNACLGSCLAQNFYRTRSVTAGYWFCEDAHAQGLFPASRLNADRLQPAASLNSVVAGCAMA